MHFTYTHDFTHTRLTGVQVYIMSALATIHVIADVSCLSTLTRTLDSTLQVKVKLPAAATAFFMLWRISYAP